MITGATYDDTHVDELRLLEAESVHVIREVVAELQRPVLLFSAGKDTDSLPLDHLEAVTDEEGIADLAALSDGLRAEREQGMTIDLAYRFFSTANRSYILADTPGHERYTRNMFTGASNAHVATLLVDARAGCCGRPAGTRVSRNFLAFNTSSPRSTRSTSSTSTRNGSTTSRRICGG